MAVERHTDDLVVSNPPYIAPDDDHLPALRHEPVFALVSDRNGMADIEQIAEDSRRVLRPNGWLVFEHGADQGESARSCLRTWTYDDVFTVCDTAGLDRVSGGRRPG